MAKTSPSKLIKLLLSVVVLGIAGTLISGCSGGGSDAPTNTGKSQYIDSGKTAADKIGAERARAHQRLPQGGATPP